MELPVIDGLTTLIGIMCSTVLAFFVYLTYRIWKAFLDAEPPMSDEEGIEDDGHDPYYYNRYKN